MAKRPAKPSKPGFRPHGRKGRAYSQAVRERAIVLFATGMSYEDIAKETKVSTATLFDWRRTPEFVNGVADIHARVRQQATDHLAALVIKATKTLDGLMDRADEAPTQRAAAADVLRLVGMQPAERHEVTVRRTDLSKLDGDDLDAAEAMHRKLRPKGSDGDGSGTT